MQLSPHPNDGSYNIWSRLANCLRGIRFESVEDRRTDGEPLLYYKLILWAYGSGELKVSTDVM